MYLVANDLLDLPILYLSRYINHNKAEYYRLIQKIRDNAPDNEIDWENWIIFMLKGVELTAKETVVLINEIKKIMRDLDVSRQTASKYLDDLFEIGLVNKIKIVNTNYYINQQLVNLFINQADLYK